MIIYIYIIYICLWCVWISSVLVGRFCIHDWKWENEWYWHTSMFFSWFTSNCVSIFNVPYTSMIASEYARSKVITSMWIPIGFLFGSPSCKPRVQRAPNRGCGDDNQKIEMWKKTWDTHRNISYHIISYHVVYCCDVSDSDGDEENEHMLYVFRMIVGCCQQSLWMLLWQVTSLEYFLHMYAHTFFGYIQYWHPWHLWKTSFRNRAPLALSLVLVCPTMGCHF